MTTQQTPDVSGRPEPAGAGHAHRSEDAWGLTSAVRRLGTRWAAGVAAGGAVAVGLSLSLVTAPELTAQNLGSPAFANPSEVRSRADEKRLRAVMQLTSGSYLIPNVGTQTLRQMRGWDSASPPPPAGGIAPGPTLRARLGDQVQISFLNKIDDSMFPYTFVTAKDNTADTTGLSSVGCDQSGTVYPGEGQFGDKFPNCFHGSSTANIHYHGTHVSPDGLADNVLVQVLPQFKQQDWAPVFDPLFNSGTIPQSWAAMPDAYRKQQEALLKQHDTDAAAAAKKNGLEPPMSLWPSNEKMIAAGEWPQYIMGAFPNFFDIPDYASGDYKAGQAPGTHWYHTHKHGSTSMHILNGLAGAFVIESSRPGGYSHVIREYYDWGDTYGDHEKILVFQQYDTTQNLQRSGPGPRGKLQVLVNGKLTPTITMRPGEVQLWRLVNATEGNTAGQLSPSLFMTAGFTFRQTAKDGVQLSPANYANQPFLNSIVPGGLALAGGNRADLLVQAPTTTGVSRFVTGGTQQNPAAGTTLFFVNVTGDPVTPPKGGNFPSTWAALPPFLEDLLPPGPNDVTNPGSPVKFQWEDGRTRGGRVGGLPPHFMINGKQFEETGPIVDQCMPLDGRQDWVLENWTTIPHPFHIHINPFQVIRIETTTSPTAYEPKGDYVWQDVVAIPPGVASPDGKRISRPGRVTIRQRYVDFTGTFVLHCHILAHEDRGMMQLVRIVPAASYPSGCQKDIPQHH